MGRFLKRIRGFQFEFIRISRVLWVLQIDGFKGRRNVFLGRVVVLLLLLSALAFPCFPFPRSESARIAYLYGPGGWQRDREALSLRLVPRLCNTLDRYKIQIKYPIEWMGLLQTHIYLALHSPASPPSTANLHGLWANKQQKPFNDSRKRRRRMDGWFCIAWTGVEERIVDLRQPWSAYVFIVGLLKYIPQLVQPKKETLPCDWVWITRWKWVRRKWRGLLLVGGLPSWRSSEEPSFIHNFAFPCMSLLLADYKERFYYTSASGRASFIIWMCIFIWKNLQKND